ncbi:MAG: phosphate ABC transporter substrate-binding protein [Planctomycetes bacterium]|nr:phosphate ABC transporter substrate-binding protein [Planctomycetota bacterium]
MTSKLTSAALLTAIACAALAGCGRKSKEGLLGAGSDTMVNLMQAWAEKYHAKTGVNVQVLGGGSGVGIASLIDGTCDMASASREMKPKEFERIKAKFGVDAKEITVGYDALAVYVHKDNPMESIAIEELAEIYGAGGKTVEWSQLSPEATDLGEIVRVSRQNSSGTYAYFREAVLGEQRDYKRGSYDQSGSKDVVALVAKTKGAIGYSGMGYATEEVKMLKVAKTKGEDGIPPTIENGRSGAYPITRALYIYTIGEPKGILKEFIDWCLSPEGQKIVEGLGYVPVS